MDRSNNDIVVSELRDTSATHKDPPPNSWGAQITVSKDQTVVRVGKISQPFDKFITGNCKNLETPPVDSSGATFHCPTALDARLYYDKKSWLGRAQLTVKNSSNGNFELVELRCQKNLTGSTGETVILNCRDIDRP